MAKPRSTLLALLQGASIAVLALAGAAPAQVGFQYSAVDTAIPYDVITGEGVGTVPIHNVQVSGAPAAVQGWSLAIVNDPLVVTPMAVEQGSFIAQVKGGTGPDYFEEQIFPDGINIGVVYCFVGCSVCLYADEHEIALVTYSAATGLLAGDTAGTTTTLVFQAFGIPPVQNVVVVGGASIPTPGTSGTITLFPEGNVIARGDANGDGIVEPLADAIVALDFLFAAGPAVPCVESLDVNDDGLADIADPVGLLVYGFAGGPTPPAPFPTCGFDLTADPLGCDTQACP